MKTEPKTLYFKDYQASEFLIDQVHLHFELNDAETEVKSILHFSRNPSVKKSQAPLILNGEDMQLIQVLLDGKLLQTSDYKVDESSLSIFKIPDQFILETLVKINPAENKKLSGLYLSRGNYCTQCEPHGFRRITYFLDRPDVMTRFSTTISADKTRYPFLLSNGNLIEQRDLANNRHWVHWEDPSLKPSYLFALVAGDFDVLSDEFITQSGRKVDLKLYLEKGFKDQGEYALISLKNAMKWDEEAYGREYDLDIYMIVAVSDFNMGAMENKGLNIFNTKYVLAKPETATDDDYVAIESVIGHEYFHNWSGNRVTCRDWFQITLKEGLTVFRDQHFTEDRTSRGVARLDTSADVRTAQFAEDASPMSHPIRPDSYIEVNNFYTTTVYRKGAEVIRMVRTLLTPELFRKGMDLYFYRHDGQAVTTEEFIKAMEDASGKDLTQFRIWYRQAGTPELKISSEYEEKAKKFILYVEQSTPPTPGQEKKEALHLPLVVGLVSQQCNDMPLQLEGENKAQTEAKILEIKSDKQKFTFINVDHKPVPSLLRGFSAPVKIQYKYTDAELAWLFRCDSDPFSRYNAGQKLVINIVSDLVKTPRSQWKENALLFDAFRHLLTKKEDDLNVLSQLLILPSVSYILANSSAKDVMAVFEAREFLKKDLAKNLKPDFLTHYQKNSNSGPYQFSVEEMGRRNLKNVALSYLVATQNQAHQELAFEQFTKANNMTDAMGALIALNDCDSELREKAMEQFYSRWKNEPLVVNKWLLLQSTSTLPNTLDRVRKLLNHPAFNILNPNNVYALICSFGANTVRFHGNNSEGYEFIADQVIAIDPKNPQVAARVIQPLIKWDTVDEPRKILMKKALERISKQKSLSPDVYEIISKSLN